MVETPSPSTFRALLEGRVVQSARRRAKWILVLLDGGWTLALHLRMSGYITVESADRQPGVHVHLVIALEDGRQIFFHDTRKFGRARLLDRQGLHELEAAHGVEPLDGDFTAAVLGALLQQRSRQIKPLLLDQTLIAGIGNIYADEALWRARIHPLRSSESLSDAEIHALREAIQAALAAGLHHGGSTLRDYRNAYGEAGTNQQHFFAYDRTGQPCERCGTAIIKITVGQRGTHYCPFCQVL
jgi:formamidopyrimidine-DNA glycosylase